MNVRGNGSIEQLEKDKPRGKCRRWRLNVSTDCGRKTRVVRGTYTDAKAALSAFKAELARTVPNAQQLETYAYKWLSWREASGSYATGTLTNNAREIRAICRSPLGSKAMESITPEDCRDALMWIKLHPQRGKSELTNTTMSKIYQTLAAIMRQAHADGRIASNPMAGIHSPKPDTQEKRALAPVELAELITRLSTLPMDGRVMCLYFMALLGLRRAEACALQVDDVRRGQCHVHLAVKERHGNIGAPKSPASVRTLPMPRQLCAIVESWKCALHERGWSDAPALCCNTKGGVLRPQNLQKWWEIQRVRLGYPDITLHQLRHSNLSMVARYMSVHDLKTYAGWSSIDPARVYIHDDYGTLAASIAAAWSHPGHTKENRPDNMLSDLRFRWSGEQDLNLRPLDGDE